MPEQNPTPLPAFKMPGRQGTVSLDGPLGQSALIVRDGSAYRISSGGRTRWGTKDEIRLDGEHFIAFGNLPPRSDRSWS